MPPPSGWSAGRRSCAGPSASEIERLTDEAKGLKAKAGLADAPASKAPAAAVAPEPLANLQWDMRMIGATPTGSYALNQGKGVLVGIIDTGVDGSHPDIAPNFSERLSRNFVTDMPDIDGPCEVAVLRRPGRRGRQRPRHPRGQHRSARRINGLGIAGVAPKATLINIRAGQDSGYFFLKATLDAMTYAGDIGVDVINMSYYTDPWLFNCLDNPADSPEAQREQRVVRQATQRALNYALYRDVLPIAALGNERTDLDQPDRRRHQPGLPAGRGVRPRRSTTPASPCRSSPAGWSRSARSARASGKAYYSNYGTEQTDVSAPGGDAVRHPGQHAELRHPDPGGVPEAAGPGRTASSNPDGTPNVPNVVRDCQDGTCAYYQYLQGTSMAAPHAAGVAALIVGRLGERDRFHAGTPAGPGPDRADAVPDGDRPGLPAAAELPVHPDPAAQHDESQRGGGHLGGVLRRAGDQERVLRARHRQRLPGGRRVA